MLRGALDFTLRLPPGKNQLGRSDLGSEPLRGFNVSLKALKEARGDGRLFVGVQDLFA